MRRGMSWRVVTGVAVTLSFLAVLVTVYRFASPTLPDAWTAHAERYLSDLLRVPVRIGEIEVSWRLQGPTVSLERLQVLDRESGADALSATRAAVVIAPIKSLFALTPRLKRVEVDGLSVELGMGPDGRVRLQGLGVGVVPSQDAFGYVVAWAAMVPDLVFTGGRLTLVGMAAGQDAISASDVSMILRNREDDHRVVLAVGESSLGGQARAVVQTERLPRSVTDSTAEVFLDVRGLDIRALSQQWDLPKRLQGMADFQAWGTWAGSTLADMTVEAVARDVRSTAWPEALAPDLIAATVHGWRAGTGWRISSPGLRTEWNGEPANQTGTLSGQLEPDGTIGLHIERAGIAPASRLAAMLGDFSGDVSEALIRASPEGQLRDLRLRVGPESGLLGLSAELADFGTGSVGPIPEIRGLSAHVAAETGNALVQIAGDDVTVHFPDLFRTGIPVRRIAGPIAIAWHDDGWRVASPELFLQTPHIEGRFRVDLQRTGDLPAPILDFQARVRHGEVEHAPLYYPVGAMGSKVLEWLERSLVSGRLTEGGVIYRGPVTDFPFREGTGTFQAAFGVEDMVLDYGTNWPRVDGLNALVSFRNEQFLAENGFGTILDVKAGPARAVIDDLWKPVLHLTVQAEAEAAEFMEFVKQSPLRNTVGRQLAPLDVVGTSSLALSAHIPLRGGEAATVEGLVGFQGGNIDIPDWNVEFADVHGDVEFTNDGVRFDGLQARWQDAQLSLATEPPVWGGDFRFSASGEVPIGTLLDFAGVAPGVGVQGVSAWTGALEVARGGGSASLEFASDLVGTGVDLPAPLGKAPSDRRAFGVGISLSSGAPAEVALEYADVIQVLAELTGFPGPAVLTRAGVRLGSGKPQLPPEGGLSIHGSMPKLTVDPWLARLEGGASIDPGITLRDVDVRFDELALAAGTAEAVRLRLEPTRWRVDVGGGLASGVLYWPRNGGPIIARLGTLGLAAGNQSDSRDWRDPRSIPALDVEVDDFLWNGTSIGRLALKTRKQAQGLELRVLEVNGADLELQASGQWKMADAHRASLEGRAQSKDMGRLAEKFGFVLGLEEAPANLTFELSWHDALPAPSVDSLSGQLEVRVGPGRLLDLDPGVGRVLGLLNIRTLRRRLALDFKDFYSKGFGFDSMEGRFTLLSGQAHTEDFIIKAPAAEISIQGRVGLATRDYDQLVTVTPGISGTLSLAGAIAGGPVVGAALFLAENMISTPFDRVGEAQYTVTGGWDEPEIKRLRAEPVGERRLEGLAK